MLHASKPPDESGNYNYLMRVTYGFEISINSYDRFNFQLMKGKLWIHVSNN